MFPIGLSGKIPFVNMVISVVVYAQVCAALIKKTNTECNKSPCIDKGINFIYQSIADICWQGLMQKANIYIAY